VAHACYPNCAENHKQEDSSPGLGEKGDPISKIANAKRANRVAQVIEGLLSKCKALSSTSNTIKI
jgi:hypothetical protein